MAGSGTGFGVHPAALRNAAEGLRQVAGQLAREVATSSDAAESGAVASGEGPLATSLEELGRRLAEGLRAAEDDVSRSADALEASATRYLTDDAAAGDALTAVLTPHLDPVPR